MDLIESQMTNCTVLFSPLLANITFTLIIPILTETYFDLVNSFKFIVTPYWEHQQSWPSG